jgi:hypothetical protein
LYVTSRCVGFAQIISTFVMPVGNAETLANSKISTGGCEFCFKYTLVSTEAVPGPPNCSVRALANQCPSGDRDSADQIMAESRQPNTRAQSPIIMSKDVLQLRELLSALASMIPPLSVESEHFIALRRIGPGEAHNRILTHYVGARCAVGVC